MAARALASSTTGRLQIASAALSAGMGAYDFSAAGDCTLALPADVRAGAYASTVTHVGGDRPVATGNDPHVPDGPGLPTGAHRAR